MEFSANASAEANGIKIEGEFCPQLTINHQSIKMDNEAAFPIRLLASIRKAFKPAKYEDELAKARYTNAKSICNTYALYRNEIPSLSDSQALLLASGYVLTPGEADNVMTVLSNATKHVGTNSDPDKLSTQFKDCFINGSATAYDKEVRQLWSDLLGAEIAAPGSYSKRTMKILESMCGEDARAFETLCASSLRESGTSTLVPVLISSNGECHPFDNLREQADRIGVLESLGLVDRSTWMSYSAQPNQQLQLQIKAGVLVVTNISSKNVDFNFGCIRFLPPGLELASLCMTGITENLPELAKRAAARDGLSFSLLERPTSHY